jgi:hypothetical protein
MSLHTAGDLLNFHPHLHALLLPRVIDLSGNYLEIAHIDQELLCEYFSEEVFGMFLERELLTHQDVLSMKSWKHSGFSVEKLIGI